MISYKSVLFINGVLAAQLILIGLVNFVCISSYTKAMTLT